MQQMEEEVSAVPLLAVPKSSKQKKKNDGSGDKDEKVGGQPKKLGDKERSIV